MVNPVTPERLPKQLTQDLRILRVTRNWIEAVRPDGLSIFLDRPSDDLSVLLNELRVRCSAEAVLRILGFVRGYQISLSYARRYLPCALPQLEAEFASVQKGLRQLIKQDTGRVSEKKLQRLMSPALRAKAAA